MPLVISTTAKPTGFPLEIPMGVNFYVLHLIDAPLTPNSICQMCMPKMGRGDTSTRGGVPPGKKLCSQSSKEELTPPIRMHQDYPGTQSFSTFNRTQPFRFFALQTLPTKGVGWGEVDSCALRAERHQVLQHRDGEPALIWEVHHLNKSHPYNPS